MTDLVERLRDDSGEPDIRLFRLRMREAADEIERLRDECELWMARAYAEGFVPAAERKE